MTSLSKFSLALWIRLPKKVYWLVHFKVRLTNSFYCNSMQSRKNLSLLFAAPFPFSRGPMSQYIRRQSKALGKHKILSLWPWYYLDQKSEDTDWHLWAKWCNTTVWDPGDNLRKQQPSHDTTNLGAWATVPTLQRDLAHWSCRTEKAVKIKG